MKAKCWSYFILRRYYLLSLVGMKGLLVGGRRRLLDWPLLKGGLCGRQGGSCRLPAASGAFVLHAPSWRKSLRWDQSVFGAWLACMLLHRSTLVFWVCETGLKAAHTQNGDSALWACAHTTPEIRQPSHGHPPPHSSAVLLFSFRVLEERKL